MILKGLKNIFLLKVLIIIFIIFNINFLSTFRPVCAIMPEGDCLNNSGVAIMHISNYSNAHVSIVTQPNFPGNLVGCCQGIETGSSDCDPGLGNKILGISNYSNAHVERKEFNNYSQYRICYTGFENVTASTINPGGNFFRVVSISNTSNAHISLHTGSGIHVPYSRVVYAEYGEGDFPPTPDECQLIDAYWMVPPLVSEGGLTPQSFVRINENNNHVGSGTLVQLRVEGNSYCNGEASDLIIREHNSVSQIPPGGNLQEVFLGPILTKSWEAKSILDYVGSGNYIQRFFFNASVTDEESGDQIFRNSGRFEGDLLHITSPSDPNYNVNVCFDYNWYYQPPLPPVYPLNASNEVPCNSDSERVATDSAGDSGVDCGNEDITCFCKWYGEQQGEGCKFGWGVTWGEINAGECITSYNLTNTCEEDPFDSFSYTVTGNWVWDVGCGEECQADNAEIAAQCNSILNSSFGECPTEIPLSFFTFYNLIATILIISGVYVVLRLSKSKKSKENSR